MLLEKIEKRIAQLKKKLEDMDPSDRQYFYTLGVIDGMSAANELAKKTSDGAHEKIYILHTDGTIQSLVKNKQECGFYIDIESALKDAHAIDHLNS